MSWIESDFLNEADMIINEERITLNQKMRTRLTLEQKRWISGVIERLNYYLKTKAHNFYRLVFSGGERSCDEKNTL